jgi:hypothetical protein
MRNIAAVVGRVPIAAGVYLRELGGLRREPWMVHRIYAERSHIRKGRLRHENLAGLGQRHQVGESSL